MSRNDAMAIYEHAVDLACPGLEFPPGIVTGKSSMSSSFHSLPSDDGGVLADVANFEDIGLGDDIDIDIRHLVDQQFKTIPNLYSPNFLSEFRTAPSKKASVSVSLFPTHRESSSPRAPRSLASRVQSRPPFPSLKKQVHSISLATAGGPAPKLKTNQSPVRLAENRCLRPILAAHPRSPSPNPLLGIRDANQLMKPRRSSWQSNRERKTALQLELECDDDDSDDIPDGLVLSNVPISPRPPQERSTSQPSSKSPSPDRVSKKEKVRNVGNGTPPVAAAQGSLRSPSWKSDSAVPSIRSASSSGTSTPVNARDRGWKAALRDLSAEARALTEKLEEHAGDLEVKLQRSSTGSLPLARESSETGSKPRVKSALAELPPLRRTNIMIDPLPISKEKEAVLSRTRPSWLPPKNPAEERRHLREYQKMINQSLEADRRREVIKRTRSECRDTAADSLMHLWEEDILPRWNKAIRERRTRELWWRGIAPRSRGAVWSLAIGNDLGLSEKSYEAALGRAREVEARIKSNMTNTISLDPRYVAWFNAIDKDVEEHTWRDLRIFQVGGPLHQGLVDVLHAYSMYRSDIGYISGCNVSAPGTSSTSRRVDELQTTKEYVLTHASLRQLPPSSSSTFRAQTMPLWPLRTFSTARCP